jgi:hypothetical protein
LLPVSSSQLPRGVFDRLPAQFEVAFANPARSRIGEVLLRQLRIRVIIDLRGSDYHDRRLFMAVVCSFAQYMATLPETILMQIITSASV